MRNRKVSSTVDGSCGDGRVVSSYRYSFDGYYWYHPTLYFNSARPYYHRHEVVRVVRGVTQWIVARWHMSIHEVCIARGPGAAASDARVPGLGFCSRLCQQPVGATTPSPAGSGQ